MQPKKILLVALNAKYIHSNPAVYSLAAYANRGLTKLISLIELTINDRYEDILSGILSRKAGIIGFSVYIWNADLMQRVMADIHAIAPEVILMAGGPRPVMIRRPICSGVRGSSLEKVSKICAASLIG